MSTLTLDKTDPEIAGSIQDWQDGQEYTLSNVVVRQTGSTPENASFEVVSIEVEEAAPEEPEAPAPASTNKAPAVQKVASKYATPSPTGL